MRRLLLSLGVAMLSACASLRPIVPEVFYRIGAAYLPDSVCAELATALVAQANLARDSSYDVPLGGSRCHEILYAADGNEIWIQLRATELTVAVRNYPHPGDLEPPNASTQTLADSAIGILTDRFPEATVTRATERD